MVSATWNFQKDVIKSVPALYYRFHGVPELYASAYSVKKMKQVTDRIKAFRGVNDVYLYFNNDIHAEAIRNARELRNIVESKPALLSEKAAAAVPQRGA